MTVRELIAELEDIVADNQGADGADVWIRYQDYVGTDHDKAYAVHIDREGDVVIVTNDARITNDLPESGLRLA